MFYFFYFGEGLFVSKVPTVYQECRSLIFRESKKDIQCNNFNVDFAPFGFNNFHMKGKAGNHIPIKLITEILFLLSYFHFFAFKEIP